MEQLTYRFSLDTHKNGSQRTLQGFETGDTISRQLIISLTENEESYELPLDNVVAVMYVKRPSQSSPSINACTIEGNQIIYDITADDLQEEGIVQMQLKVVSGTIANPHRVLVSPRFNIEVWESFAADSEAEDSQEYTALEDALIRAKMCYDGRIADYNIDDDGTLTVVYGIVDDYNEDEAYAVNDKCYYGGKAWKCLQACTGETPEEGSYWTEISIDEAHITYTSDYLKNAIIAVSPTITVGTVTTGSPTSVTNSGTTTNAVFDFVLEKGEKGDDGADGADGQDGVSPVANVTKSGDTATITITDAIGTTTATISDGTDGTNGQDGFSPVANVSKTGNTATITITDAIGTTTAQISDGAGGDTVSWNQITQSGTKIATVTINNTPTDVYAPTSGGGGGATSLAGLDDVTISSASNGQALVYDSSATKWKNTSLSIPADIDDLTDVTISSASDGQVLTYDNANSVWKNASLPSTDLDDLTDVTISSATDGQVLTYDNANSVWKNASLPSTGIDDLSDVTITSATSGDFLKYDGSKWINGAGGNASAINDLTDVTITSATNGQVLTYDSANSIWKNANATGGGLLPHLIVITEEDSTVTAVKGTTTINLVETSTEHYEADLTDYGTWTIHSVLSGDDATTSIVIDACKIYTVDDAHFSASITVYYPQGGTCSCSMTGEQTLYANTCPYTFTVHKAGTWTISTTEYGETFTETVVITTDGQSETVSLPDGSVITPTDDVPALLACAGIGDSQDATLADLLADSATLLAVLTTDNAIDYLVRSTTFAADITADADAMAMIGSYDYASDTLTADATWNEAIATSSYMSKVNNVQNPTMTSDTTPSGKASASSVYNSAYSAYKAFDENADASHGWLGGNSVQTGYVQYEFERQMTFHAFKYKRLLVDAQVNTTWAISGSVDGTNFETILDNITDLPEATFVTRGVLNSDSYKIIRFAISSNYQISYGDGYKFTIYGRRKGGVQSWLKSANIDKPYTTLAEVLADTTTLSALISNHDAVDYLVTAKGLIDGIVADATAMSYIGLNNYCANTLIADSEWLTAIAHSTYIDSVLNLKNPTMTDTTTPSGEASASGTYGQYYPWKAFDNNSNSYWLSALNATTNQYLRYKFASVGKICAFKIYSKVVSNEGVPASYKAQAYVNNAWKDVSDTFTNSATTLNKVHTLNEINQVDDYRIYISSTYGSGVQACGIYELTFYGREDV